MTTSKPSHQDAAGPQGPDVPARRRGGCTTALMLIAGIVLVLPGLCAGAVMIAFPQAILRDGSMFALWLICLLIGFGGFALLVRAFR